MAWSNEKLQKLVDHILKIVEEPEKAEENKEAAVSLLQEMYSALTSIDPSAIDLSQVYQTLYDKREHLILKKEMGLIEGEITGELLRYHKNTLDVAKMKVAAMVKSGEYTQQQISSMQAEVRMIADATKEIENYEKGMQKGQVVAEEILASTLGISKNFLSKDGILGSIEGFGKGLKGQLSAGNIAATIALKVFESFMQLDNATTSLFQKSGMTGYSKMLVELGNDLALTYGPDSTTVGAELLSEVIQARRDFGFMNEDDVRESVYLAGQLGRLGVSVSAFSDLGQFMTLNLGMTSEEQEGTLNKIYSIAAAQKISPERVFREIAETTPVFARFGRRFADVFAGMSVAAKRTNLNMATLVQLTESLDTTENAYRQAQKFNALLGGNFLNPAALLEADPVKKVKLIASAYQRANAAMGEIHPRVLRRMYQLFGLDATKFANLVTANFEGFEEEVGKIQMTPEQKLQDKLKVDIEKSKSAGEKVTNALAKFGKFFFKGLFNMLSKISSAIITMVKLAYKYSIFGIADAAYNYITGLFADRKKKKEEKRRQLADQAEIAKIQEDQLRQFEGENALSVESAMNNPELFERGMSALNMSQGMPINVQESQTETENVFGKFDRQDMYQRNQREELERRRQQMRMAPALGLVPDSPTAMSTSNNLSSTTQVPVVNASFETSSDDDVLLSRLARLRDKLTKYGETQTKVRLNVGTGTIAEATV